MFFLPIRCNDFYNWCEIVMLNISFGDSLDNKIFVNFISDETHNFT